MVTDCGRCRVSVHGFVEIETLDAWPNVKVRAVPLGLVACFVLTGLGCEQAWVERAMERPAVKAGMQVP